MVDLKPYLQFYLFKILNVISVNFIDLEMLPHIICAQRSLYHDFENGTITVINLGEDIVISTIFILFFTVLLIEYALFAEIFHLL